MGLRLLSGYGGPQVCCIQAMVVNLSGFEKMLWKHGDRTLNQP